MKGHDVPQDTDIINLIDRFDHLSVDSLDIGKYQARIMNAGEGLEELAASIEMKGQLQPILVCKSERDPNRWEIICGQRRFAAHKKILKRDYIQAAIVDRVLSKEEAEELSLTENVMRLKQHKTELQDRCVELFRRYGTYKAVAEKTGLPMDFIQKHVYYEGLPEMLKEQVDSGLMNTKLAYKIQKASSGSVGLFDEARATELIGQLKVTDDKLHPKFLDVAVKNKEASAEDLIKLAEKPDKSMKFMVQLFENAANAMREKVKADDSSKEEIAEEFISDGLVSEGYLELENDGN
jgi:ParB/RepB/Spo0J family partition protein